MQSKSQEVVKLKRELAMHETQEPADDREDVFHIQDSDSSSEN